MFPSQRGNEMVIEFSSRPHHHHHQQQHKISEDLILEGGHAPASLDIINFSDKQLQGSSKNKPKKLLYESSRDKINHYRNSDIEYTKKEKLIHREIERQRRQEMATLYASLRSLLPLEFIKGKRSISDHMNEAKNYIKHLQKKIKELSAKRDELKKLSENSWNPETQECEKYTYSGFFSVHEINNNGGIGIEVSSSLGEESFPLSKLLKLMLDEGLGVVNSVTSQVNARLIHCVQCEVINSSDRVDIPVLRRKIVNLVPSFTCSD